MSFYRLIQIPLSRIRNWLKDSRINSFRFAFHVLKNSLKLRKSTNDNGQAHRIIVPWATYSPWLLDESFQKVYESIKDKTLIDIYRLYELWSIAHQQRDVEGDFLEVGVWRGGSGVLLGKALAGTDKKLFLADTFSGVVNAGPNDSTYKGGEHADVSLSEVRSLLRENGIPNSEILVGEFPLKTAMSIEGNLSLVHIDVDVYNSAKDILNWCLPRMKSGAIIVFDDYGFISTDGVTKLVNESLATNTFLFIHNLNGHAILMKK